MHCHGGDGSSVVDAYRMVGKARLKLEETVIGADPYPSLRVFQGRAHKLIRQAIAGTESVKAFRTHTNQPPAFGTDP